MSDPLENIRRFIKLAELHQRIIDADNDDWEAKYDLVFSVLKGDVNGTGIQFEWFDYDTSYEEDARQYVAGLVRKAESLKAILDSLETIIREEVKDARL